ncbi:MAG TPA: 6-phosphogluconolactonase [Gemmatimonadaceae bacterium]|nr:6-phosphogluconolactonase [Gemmatimonadaceae bacterium]
MTQVRLFDSAAALGSHLADRLLHEIELARAAKRHYMLGCPTGRTPRPIYAAMAQRLSSRPQDLSHIVLVMMDEYLVEGTNGLINAPDEQPWSCHYFARREIRDQLNKNLPANFQLPSDSLWFPQPTNLEEYDSRIVRSGGIDFFILASGASDGHVAFNPPGSPRDSRTRIVALSEQTRRDNLQTFPAFGTIDAVPKHGASVGIATIAAARAGVMVLTGAAKSESFSRVLQTDRYDPQWPATVIHELRTGEIFADREAAAGWGETPT